MAKKLRGRARREAWLAWKPLRLPPLFPLRIPPEFPPEIVAKIAGYLCDTRIQEFGKFSFPTLRWLGLEVISLPRQVKSLGIPSFWGSKHVVFEFPQFSPRSLVDFENGEIEWPSRVRFHDRTENFSYEVAPPFLAKRTRRLSIRDTKCLRSDLFEDCPFDLFASITIRIPPCTTTDPVEFIMNWNRIRYIAYALSLSWHNQDYGRFDRQYEGIPDSKTPLPTIRIEFLGSMEDWCDDRGQLKNSLDLSHELVDDGSKEAAADLVNLLRALAPLRGARDIKIDIPFTLPDSERDRAFSVKWFSNSEIQRYKYGTYMEIGNWTDCDSMEWTERFELILHTILHRSRTPLAPYLRLEQFSSITVHDRLRITAHAAKYSSQSALCDGGQALMTAVWHCALALAPVEIGWCRCPPVPPREPEIFNWQKHSLIEEGECPKYSIANYNGKRAEWTQKFQEIYKQLQGSSASQCDRQLVLADFVEAEDWFSAECEKRPKKDWQLVDHVNSLNCFSELDCYSCGTGVFMRRELDDWVRLYPGGVVHDHVTMQKAKARHSCRHVEGVWKDDLVFRCIGYSV